MGFPLEYPPYSLKELDIQLSINMYRQKKFIPSLRSLIMNIAMKQMQEKKIQNIVYTKKNPMVDSDDLDKEKIKCIKKHANIYIKKSMGELWASMFLYLSKMLYQIH